jgi:hypothetical protein
MGISKKTEKAIFSKCKIPLPNIIVKIKTHNCDILSFVPFENHEPDALNRLDFFIGIKKTNLRKFKITSIY